MMTMTDTPHPCHHGNQRQPRTITIEGYCSHVQKYICGYMVLRISASCPDGQLANIAMEMTRPNVYAFNKNHPIAHPQGWAMGCLWWVLNLYCESWTVCWTASSGYKQIKHHYKLYITGPLWGESTSRWLVDSPHKGPVMGKVSPHHDVRKMTIS